MFELFWFVLILGLKFCLNWASLLVGINAVPVLTKGLLIIV